MVRWKDLIILGWMMGGWVWMEGWVFAFDIIQAVHICYIYASLMHVLFLEWVRLRWWLEHLKISGSGIGFTHWYPHCAPLIKSFPTDVTNLEFSVAILI